MKKLFIPLIALCLMGCSSIKTSYDYDKQVDFSKYKTYNFSQDDLVSTIGELNRKRVIDAVEADLTSKGFTKASNPDVLVDVFITTEKKMEATATTSGYGGYGYGPYRYGYGGGYSTTQVSYDTYTEGTLIISMVDNASQKIVWQGTGTKTISETSNAQKREDNINYAVKSILYSYPPKSK